MPLLLLLLPLLARAGEGAPAQETPAAPSAAPAPQSGVEVTADLRDEYLFNQDIIVTFTVRNGGSEPATVPDLSARPWRVRFRLTSSGGQTQTRFTTPPAAEPNTSWTLPPRSQRRVALEIPGGGALKEGSWSLAITVDLGDHRVSLPARAIRIAAAHPVTAQLAADPLLTERLGLQTLWLHQAAQGYDLYLTLSDAKNPARVVSNTFLDHLAQPVQPQLTAAKRSDAGDRYVLWPEGSHGVRYARLEGNALRAEARLLSLPWPRIEIAGQGATDASAGLHIPIWVPAPEGAAGELRLVSVDERGRPQLRRVIALPERPPEVVTAVDASGGVHLLVKRGDKIDLYSLPSGYGEGLPVPGKRIWLGKSGQTLLDARYGNLGASGTVAGGLAVLVAYTEGATLQAQWVSLKGAALQAPFATPWVAGSKLLALLPAESGAPGLLIRTAEGPVRYQEGAAVAAATLPTLWGLVRDAQGRPNLLGALAGQGVRATALEPKTAP